MTSSIEHRIDTIIRELRPTGDCDTCHGFPTRIVLVDDHGISDMPPDGCPACGRPIRNTTRLGNLTLEDMRITFFPADMPVYAADGMRIE